MVTKLKVKVSGRWFAVEVPDTDLMPVMVLVDGEEIEVRTELVDNPPPSSETITLDPYPAKILPNATSKPIKTFNTPMPGVILSVAVNEGDQVIIGDEICVLEAMKMQQKLRAEWSGIVGLVHVKEGQQVLGGDPILDWS